MPKLRKIMVRRAKAEPMEIEEQAPGDFIVHADDNHHFRPTGYVKDLCAEIFRLTSCQK